MRRSIVTATSAAVVTAALCTAANALAVSPGLLVKSTETSVTQVHWRHRHWRGWHRPSSTATTLHVFTRGGAIGAAAGNDRAMVVAATQVAAWI
jgi:hypothetical protein